MYCLTWVLRCLNVQCLLQYCILLNSYYESELTFDSTQPLFSTLIKLLMQGRMLGNPYSSNEPGLGPLMRDVKNKICQDCELVALLEDDNGMELLVNNKIISLDLPVREVLYRRLEVMSDFRKWCSKLTGNSECLYFHLGAQLSVLFKPIMWNQEMLVDNIFHKLCCYLNTNSINVILHSYIEIDYYQ